MGTVFSVSVGFLVQWLMAGHILESNTKQEINISVQDSLGVQASQTKYVLLFVGAQSILRLVHD